MLALARQLWGEPNRDLSTRTDVRFGHNGSKSVKPDKEVYFDHEAETGGGYRDLYKLVHGTFPPNGRDKAAGGFFIPKSMLRELGSPTGQWDYPDERHQVVARVLRFDPPAKDGESSGKTFRQCRPDGDRWKWSTTGIEVPLYRLPELLAAAADALVFIVEGERKADALAEWGLLATTSIMGARKFRPHNAKTLAGRRCIILPDNDEAGRAHVQIIMRELRKVEATAYIVELPGLQEKGDIVDWIAAGHTRDELLKLIEAAAASAPSGNGKAVESEVSDTDVEAEIARLARLPLLKYEQQRLGAAKLLGVRGSILDRLVAIERGDGAGDTKGQGKPLDLPSPEPWPGQVSGALLLHVLTRYFTRHLVLPPGAARAMALWAVHCHCFDVFRITPRLHFKSPTKGSGKSTAIELLRGVVPRPLEIETISQAFLFRAIEIARPTLLMDEVDNYLREDLDLRAMINAGVKANAAAGRCVGDNQEPRMFSCHAPIALGGIGSLPGPIEDRIIQVLMKRRSRQERIQPIEDSTHRLADRLQRKAARWAQDHATELRAARPDMGRLFNRPAERWRALYAIADVAGASGPISPAGQWRPSPSPATTTRKAWASDCWLM